MYGRSLDVVPWTKRNAFPEEYGKLFRKALAAAHEPGAALANWLHRYTEFLATKRGLATALHSGDPAFDALPGYFYQRLEPALGSLLDAAAATGEIRATSAPETCCAPSPCCARPYRTRESRTASAWSPSSSTDCTTPPNFSGPPNRRFEVRQAPKSSCCFIVTPNDPLAHTETGGRDQGDR